MKNKMVYIAALIVMLVFAGQAHSAGTAAGTDITNNATATYSVGGTNITSTSNTVTITVAEMLNVTVTWQDAADIPVAPGDAGQALTMLVTNTGNGNETFSLTADSTLGGDDFDPTLSGIFFDTNGNGSYDAGTDIQYVSGVNDPTLAADGSVTIFVVNDIPAAGLVDGNIGNSSFTATSKTGSGAAGTKLAGAGDGGVDAVIGGSGGTQSETASYVVSTVTVDVVKSASVTDPFGGTEPVPGATITYTITVTVTGAGTATGLVITDPIPANTTYKTTTLELDGTALSDGSDGDAGDVGVTTADTVTVTLGDVAGGGAAQVITFNVNIN